jgi:hypothetical protein
MGVIFKRQNGDTVSFEKFNPYHGKDGRFTSRGGHISFSPGKNEAQAARSIAAENARRKAEGEQEVVGGAYYNVGRKTYAEALTDKKARTEAEKKSKSNPLGDPDKIAGVERGEPMTRDQANRGKVNPNFSNGGGYWINCQTCVVAYEARLRGYDVQAKPKTTKEQNSLAYNSRLAWIDPKTGNNPKFITDKSVKNAKSCRAWMEKTVQSGERYTFEFPWSGRRSGHIVSLDKNSKGVLRLYDPQSGKILHGDQIDTYLKRGIKFQTYGVPQCKLMRVDNMRIDSKMANAIMEAVK